jgi:hypothetical protein
MKLFSLLGAGLLAGLLAGHAHAAPGNPRRAAMKQAMIAHFDTDHDGRLDHGERRAMIARFDRDGDGRLDHGERRAIKRLLRRELRQGRRGGRGGDPMVRRFDLNHDGVVGPGEVPPNVARRLRRLDVNGAGWVDPGERAAGRRR